MEPTKITPTQITITDNMRIFALALVARLKDPELEGLSNEFKHYAAVGLASNDVHLDPDEIAAVKQLIKENRLGELAI